jgi:hypothetical protein
MARVEATPVPHAVFNEFDRHGILLGLPRIAQERNPAYRQRLFDVNVRRASSTYLGLINGITRELGLEIEDTMNVITLLDSNGDPLLPNPAVVFEDTKCILYRDFGTKDILTTIDRYDFSGIAYTLDNLVAAINGSGFFGASLTGQVVGNKRSMTLFNQSTVGDVTSEDISGSGSRIVLDNINLIANTVTVRSPNLTRLVTNEIDIVRSGDYTVNFKEGLLIARGAPAPGSFIKYKFRNDNFVAQSSPVILHNLQSDDFKTKMFQQVCTDGVDCNGLPNVLGASLINELMSVFPANWGT